jgi:hypothetical protein
MYHQQRAIEVNPLALKAATRVRQNPTANGTLLHALERNRPARPATSEQREAMLPVLERYATSALLNHHELLAGKLYDLVRIGRAH